MIPKDEFEEQEMTPEEEAQAQKEYEDAKAAQDAWEKENHFRRIDTPHCGNCVHWEGGYEGEGDCKLIQSRIIPGNTWSELFSNGGVVETNVCDNWKSCE